MQVSTSSAGRATRARAVCHLAIGVLAGIMPAIALPSAAQVQDSAAPNAAAVDVPEAGTQVGNSRFERAVGPTVLNRGSELYQFISFKLDSADGQRHYWV